jgi:AcrR family transcriptional regulator
MRRSVHPPHEARATALERALDGDGAKPRPTPLDTLRVARRIWLAEQRLDMGALAGELGTSRATLYNWVGSKDRLIGEVIWSFAEPTIERARAEATGSGAEYVADVSERFVGAVATFAPLRRFIEQDPEYALRVLTSKHSALQRRMISVNTQLLEEQVATGKLTLPLDLNTVAYLIVRIAESFLYTDVITGGEPAPAKAGQAIRVLLQAPPTGAG